MGHTGSLTCGVIYTASRVLTNMKWQLVIFTKLENYLILEANERIMFCTLNKVNTRKGTIVYEMQE